MATTVTGAEHVEWNLDDLYTRPDDPRFDADVFVEKSPQSLLAGQGDWDNLWSTGTVPEAGWFSWLGPVMLATVLGSFTLLGFETAANFAEETQNPTRVFPRILFGAIAITTNTPPAIRPASQISTATAMTKVLRIKPSPLRALVPKRG